MKHAMCPACGRRLIKGEAGSKVEVVCPKCGKTAIVTIGDDHLHIIDKPLTDKHPMEQTRQAI